MPGSFLIRPVEANLIHNTELIGKMSPYCKFIIGEKKIDTQVCKRGGKNPHWKDTISIKSSRIVEPKLLIELLDKDVLSKDDVIGVCSVDLNEIEANQKVSRWYPVFYKHKPAGEIYLKAVFKPDIQPVTADLIQTEAEKIITTEQVLIKHDELVPQTKPFELLSESEHVIAEKPVPSRVFTEQQQMVVPHTFLKNVDVVETRTFLKEIEVMEPRKVMKVVEYTEAVPVMKLIEVTEPQVIRKEIEVIEPRVVTKTIQVIENVPIKRQVEIVEMRNHIKEVETFEPQTFHKQVEVIEHVPVMKTVTVNEPVTITKAVEFVEPIITTQTITKEIIEPMVVGEKITTTVGPATVIDSEIETKIITESAFIEKKIVEEKIFDQNIISTL